MKKEMTLDKGTSPSQIRVAKAFNHQTPDRTPLFEIFQPFHPIHWDIAGRTVGTDEAMCWDAMADGIAWEELVEAKAQAAFQVNKFFEVDMVRLNRVPKKDAPRPVKTGPKSWKLEGVDYVLNERTCLVELSNPGEKDSYSQRVTEEEMISIIEKWDGKSSEQPVGVDPVYRRVRQLAEAEGIHWVYMAEIGAGTGVAYYPPFLLMWMMAEPELFSRWLEMKKLPALKRTRELVEQGHAVVAIGGDVSCDKGPFISPATYHEFILPAIQEHTNLIHEGGSLVVYTSDGNHWPIKEDFFFNSGVDGYKEVDKAAGMTFERLIAEGVKKRLCLIGNIDARYTLCQGRPDEVGREVVECLKLGQQSPGGHILHASHSVHEDVKSENYYAAVNAYREYFGMKPLSRPGGGLK
ncbi:MAG: uroporphyrinogen decarboxylase family protein [Verrucomicrobiae bacterium]|nr:uroporphyrinogen decarboxylase family protein [Verrucomicrobiae bacterium]